MRGNALHLDRDCSQKWLPLRMIHTVLSFTDGSGEWGRTDLFQGSSFPSRAALGRSRLEFEAH